MADVIAWILIGLVVIWTGSNVVSLVKAIIKKLRSRGMAPVEAQNTNTEKESDQSNSFENGSEE